MSVASAKFLIFLAATIIVFYIVPSKHRWLVLLTSSIAFYLIAGSWRFLPFIIFTSLVIWLASRRIGKLYEELETKLKAEGLDRKGKKALKDEYKKKAKTSLVLSLVLCIGILCVTKFTKYVVAYLNLFMVSRGNEPRFGIEWLIVPLGISYYTFSTVGYILDVYWKRYKYESNFLRFFLYAIFFPHIMQGPISRYNLLGQSLKQELKYDSQRIVFGAQLMMWGFFKKLVIADRLNKLVTTVFNGEVQAGSVFLVALFFDALMIYTDFSGYTDIARGASQIFGVELEQNFNHPFFSKSVTEFWRRWHMSLGSWFKDYVFYPVTVSNWMKKLNKFNLKHLPSRVTKTISVAIPCLITWFLTGLWHGTGKTYVAWGIYYGVLITISVGFQDEFASLNKLLRIKTKSYSFRGFQMFRTFCIFMGGRLLTSAGGLHNSLMVVKNIIGNFQPWKLVDESLYGYGIDRKEMGLLIVCLIVLWAVSMLQERVHIREIIARQNVVVRWALMYLIIFVILIFGVYGAGYDASAFIYTQY